MSTPIYQGCFSASIPLVNQGYHKFQSSGWCTGVCDDIDEPVLGLSNGTLCWCGILLPPAESKVSDNLCDTPCQGYDLEDCGGRNGSKTYWTVWLTGTKQNVQNFKASGALSSATQQSSSTQSTAGSTSSTRTATTTSAPKDAPATTNSGSSSTSPPQGAGAHTSAQKTHSGLDHDAVVGIAVGVVLGVFVLALVLFLLWFLRRRRKRTGDYRRRGTPTPGQSPHTSEPKDEGPPHIEPMHPVAEAATTSSPEMSEPNRQIDNSLLAPPAPTFLNYHNRQGSQATTNTSYDQPFYTPAERSSFDFEPPAANNAQEQPYVMEPTTSPQFEHPGPEQGSMFTPGHALTTASETAEPVPFPPPILRRPVGRSRPVPKDDLNPTPNPFASNADTGLVDVGAGYMRTNSQQSSPPHSKAYARQELP